MNIPEDMNRSNIDGPKDMNRSKDLNRSENMNKLEENETKNDSFSNEKLFSDEIGRVGQDIKSNEEKEKSIIFFDKYHRFFY